MIRARALVVTLARVRLRGARLVGLVPAIVFRALRLLRAAVAIALGPFAAGLTGFVTTRRGRGLGRGP